MKLSGAVKRVAECVAREAMFLVEFFGICRLAFLTLTYKELRTDSHWAQARWESLVERHLKIHFERIIGVWERHQSDGIHWHALVVCRQDIRSGFNHPRYRELQRMVKAGVRKGWKASEVGANEALQEEWKWLKEHVTGVWGRSELTPIRVNGKAVARYLAKYVTKQASERSEVDKGCRRVRYVGFRYSEMVNGKKESRTHRKVTPRFSFMGTKSQCWRAKVATWAVKVGLTADELFAPASRMGKNWCYKHRDAIGETDCREELKKQGEHTAKALEFAEKEVADREFKMRFDQEVWKDKMKHFDKSMAPDSPELAGLMADVTYWMGGHPQLEDCEILGWAVTGIPNELVTDYLAWCGDSHHQLSPVSCDWFAHCEVVGFPQARNQFGRLYDGPAPGESMPWDDYGSDSADNATGFRGNRVAACCPVEREYDFTW